MNILARQMWFGSLASVIFLCFGSDSECSQKFVKGEKETQNLLWLCKASTVESTLLKRAHKVYQAHVSQWLSTQILGSDRTGVYSSFATERARDLG